MVTCRGGGREMMLLPVFFGALVWCAEANKGKSGRDYGGSEPIKHRLKCFYSLKKGTNAGGSIFPLDSVICPEGRDKYCVKEVAEGFDKSECGMTEFFGDTYDDTNKECIFRKCASDCDEGTNDYNSELIEKYREAETYRRRTFCCNTDYCNATPTAANPRLHVALALALATMGALLLR